CGPRLRNPRRRPDRPLNGSVLLPSRAVRVTLTPIRQVRHQTGQSGRYRAHAPATTIMIMVIWPIHGPYHHDHDSEAAVAALLAGRGGLRRGRGRERHGGGRRARDGSQARRRVVGTERVAGAERARTGYRPGGGHGGGWRLRPRVAGTAAGGGYGRGWR